MKGENRRRGKPRQDHDRFAGRDREAERLARLERDAMDEDAGLAQPRHHLMR
jgi:hypothetical protein